MQKLETLFRKDPTNLGRVIEELKPETAWALSHGIPTRKFDGTCCSIRNGELYKRFDLKKGRNLPEGATPCQSPDKISGHHPHWVPCLREDKSNKWHFIAFDLLEVKESGTYELCGEKINGNPEKIEGHKLIRHGTEVLHLPDMSFSGIRKYLESADIEGIVFHDNLGMGRMCKIRKSDFGIKR